MSTTFVETASLPLPWRARAVDPAHQSSSWPDLARAQRLVRRWVQRRAQRTALRDLAANDHLLADIGLTRAQALREAGKPFWRR